jgi:hypothetical protein
MADSMVAGLFGLTPEMYQNQQYQQDLKRGYELAQLSPGAAAQAGLQASVGQLGRGVAGLMGVEDPQMKIISARQQILGGLDQTNPTSMLEGAKMLAQMGDQQGAFALADYARKAQSEIAQAQQRMAAANRERQQAEPNDIRIANEIATLTDAQDQLLNQPASPERDRAINLITTRLTQLERLTSKAEKTEPKTEIQKLQEYAATLPAGSPQLAQVQAAIQAKGEGQGAKITNVMPGQQALADIPKFRADVQRTIAPQIQSVTAANQALEAINESIKTNNFVSFNAARVQLAKALGDSQLSRRDVEQAGGDPSLFGRLLDSTSTLFTGTPTLETQNLIKNTLTAIKKVSTNQANKEINVQKNIAYNTPGYDRARVDAALKFPEFEVTAGSPISGDVAEQARAILEQRKKSTK